jgi:Fe-S-cluster-containing dehydrogenase component
VEACPQNAMYFGDLDVAGSEIRLLLESEYAIRRKPELGTQPEIFYIV